MPVIQNFSVPAGDRAVLTFEISSQDILSLDGYLVLWQLFDQADGVPLADVEPLLTKSSETGGLEVTDAEYLVFEVTLTRDDTVGLLRNYYHEATVHDESGNYFTVCYGIATVTQTENRDP